MAASSAPLLLASSSLFVPLTGAYAAPKVASAPEKNGAQATKKALPKVAKVPAAAMAALARAQRLQREAAQPIVVGGEATAVQIEAALCQAIEAAPQWVEARRALARWHGSRRLWSAAAPAWQAVLQLRPDDREAQSEIERARRWTNAFPNASPWSDVALVRFGADSRAQSSDLVTLRSSAQTRPAPQKRPLGTSARLEAPKPTKIAAKLGVTPALPSANAAAKSAAAKRGVTVEQIRGALGVQTDEGIGETATTTQIPEDLNAIAIGDEGVISGAALPEAPAGVTEEARVALARARQMATLSVYLPEAETWATTEFRRASELAPQWIQAQRERAQWHTERGEWSDAAIAWEALLGSAPDDREARSALTKAREFAVALDLWGARNLVTFGHDSINPTAQADSVRLADAPSPLRSGDERPVALDPALVNPALAIAKPLSRLAKTTANRARLAGLRARLADTVTSSEVSRKLEKVPSLARPLPVIGKSSTLIAKASTPTSVLAAAVIKASQVITIPKPMVRVSSQVTPTLIPENVAAPTAPPVLVPVAPTPQSETPSAIAKPESSVPAPTAPIATAPTPKAPASKAAAKPVAKATSTTRKKVAIAKAKPKAKTKTKPRATTATTAATKLRVSSARKAAAWPWVNKAGKAMQAKNFPVALANYQRAYALDPTNTYAAFGIPESLMILKRYPEAISGYEKFLAMHPGHAKALRGLADSYAFSGQYDKAAQLDSAILAKNPRDFRAALQAAQVMSWAKKYEESGRFYRMALGIEPKNAAVWTEYAETLSFAKDPRAREAFGQALTLDPESQRTMIGLANLLSWSGEYAGAIPLYRGILVRDPANMIAQVGLGDALTFSSQSEAAIPVYRQALQIEPNSGSARLGLGRALTIARRYEEALGILEPLVKEQPANTEALGMLGIAQISEQPGAALGTFQELLKLQDESRARAATLANIGDLHVKLNHAAEARAAYEEAIKLTPSDDRIALAFARALMRQELYTDAEPLVAAIVQRDPANQQAVLLQATLAARTDQQERAAALARQIEAMPIEVGDDALNLFYALRSAGATEAAGRLLGRLTQSAAAKPEDALKVANAVRDSGQEEASYDLYKRVLQVNPDLHEARIELAEALIRRKEFDAAQKEVDYVLGRQPNNVSAKILGATLALRRDHSEASFDNAEIVYREALDKNPGNTQARLGLAEVMGTRSKFLESVQNYRLVLEKDPENLQARLGLARNLYYAKQVPDSIKEYQELILRAPDDTTVKLELAQVYLDRNLLDDAQRLFLEVLKVAKYPLPEAGTVQLLRRVPGSSAKLDEKTERAFRDFAVAQKAAKPIQ